MDVPGKRVSRGLTAVTEDFLKNVAGATKNRRSYSWRSMDLQPAAADQPGLAELRSLASPVDATGSILKVYHKGAERGSSPDSATSLRQLRVDFQPIKREHGAAGAPMRRRTCVRIQ